jgi:hypothetical protein
LSREKMPSLFTRILTRTVSLRMKADLGFPFESVVDRVIVTCVRPVVA